MIDFEQALTALAAGRVRFVIVGGLAITIHGSSYVTFDLYFCYARERENLSRLASSSLEALSWGLILPRCFPHPAGASRPQGNDSEVIA